MQAKELAEKITQGHPPAVIDVRTCFEFKAGHIPGALNAPVWKILLRLVPLPQDKNTELVVLCELGPRAVMGKALLNMLGFPNVTLLAGHMADWRRLGLPMVK